MAPTSLTLFAAAPSKLIVYRRIIAFNRAYTPSGKILIQIIPRVAHYFIDYSIDFWYLFIFWLFTPILLVYFD